MDNKNILTIDFGGTSVKYLLMKNGKEIDHTVTESHLILESHQKAAIDVMDKIDFFEQKYGKIAGLAISFNSPVQNQTKVRWGLIDGKWVYKDFQKILHSQGLNLHLPLHIINDAKAALYAESKIGTAKGYDNSVMLTFGTAIGGAALIEGKLVNGRSALGAELSNPVMQFDGHNYSSIKLWHSFASMSSLIVNYQKLSQVQKTGEEIFALYDAKDPNAMIAVKSFIKSIAVIIFSTVYIYGQEMTVIGGGLSNRTNIINEIKTELNDLSQEIKMDIPTEVALASVKNKAGNYGAYYYFIDKEKQDD